MKKIILTLLLLTPALAHSQQGLDPEVMQQLQEMMMCIDAVDKKEMKKMEKDAKKIQTEVQGLCKSGDRKKAQQRMIEYSKEMVKSPAFITMRNCTANIPAALKGMVPDMSEESISKKLKDKHVCDEI